METIKIKLDKEKNVDFIARGMEVKYSIDSTVYLFFTNICSIDYNQSKEILEIRMNNGNNYILTNFKNNYFNQLFENFANTNRD